MPEAPGLNLSLFHLDNELRALLEYQQERMTDTSEPMDAEEAAALAGEIQRYMQALPAKVSGVVAVVHHWRAQRATLKAEVERLRKIGAHIDAMEARLEEYCQFVLEQQPRPAKGARKLIGADGSAISLKSNGGIEPLEIFDPAQLPDDCKKTTLQVPTDEWLGMREHMLDLGLTLISESTAPDPPAIRVAILDTGGVPGARLLPRGQHVEFR